MSDLRRILPDYPRTRHLPWKPNAQRDDLVADPAECRIIFESKWVDVTEKIDGANVGMALVDGHPVIRNRNHILNKAFTQRRTAAKMQFASIFNWAYQNLEKLQVLAGYSIYGEWMYALHGLPYTHLPSYFITYDLYDYEQQQFIEPAIARDMLVKAGFEVVPLLYHGTI